MSGGAKEGRIFVETKEVSQSLAHRARDWVRRSTYTLKLMRVRVTNFALSKN